MTAGTDETQPQTLLPQEKLERAPSRASIAGHPIHPMLIPFPIAFLTGAFVTDIVFWQSGNELWAHFSRWLIIGGIIMAVVAALAGLIDFLGLKKARQVLSGWFHLFTAVAAVAFSTANAIIRWEEPTSGVLPVGIVLSGIVTVILLFVGWFGGHLVYRHGVGVEHR